MLSTNASGKVCYFEIPATDIALSSEFYSNVFGWELRKRGDGAVAFDDTVGGVSGTWVIDRPPSTFPGILVYIMVDSVAATLDRIIANGGSIARPSARIGTMTIARFNDPAGNVIGLYQEG